MSQKTVKRQRKATRNAIGHYYKVLIQRINMRPLPARLGIAWAIVRGRLTYDYFRGGNK